MRKIKFIKQILIVHDVLFILSKKKAEDIISIESQFDLQIYNSEKKHISSISIITFES